MKNKILLIPDSYFGKASGAIVAQVAKKLLKENENKVFVFSSDISTDSWSQMKPVSFSKLANWNSYNNTFKNIVL